MAFRGKEPVTHAVVTTDSLRVGGHQIVWTWEPLAEHLGPSAIEANCDVMSNRGLTPGMTMAERRGGRWSA